MTRQEIIIEAAKKYGGNNEEMRCHFIDGCHWADEYPNDEVLKLRKMFESDPDAYKQGYKDAIDKACEWMEKFVRNSVVTDGIDERTKQAIVTSFKEYMEEQQ